MAEVEDLIVQEESWMNKESPWRENLSEISVGSYRKEWKIAQCNASITHFITKV